MSAFGGAAGLAVLVCLGAASGPAQEATIGVFESETNAAQYRGIYQAPLRDWLDKHDYVYEVIGDEGAADAGGLQRFAVVMASSCYLAPDAACAGLAEYVRGGGNLIWIDGPSRCQNAELLAALGIEDRFRYLSVGEARFTPVEPEHPAAAGFGETTVGVTGNPAVRATGRVVATWAEAGDDREPFPAVVATRSGKGRAVLLNWIIWLNWRYTAPLLGNVVDWCLAEQRLGGDRPVALTLATPDPVAQPAAVTVDARAFARRPLAGALRVRLADDAGETRGEVAEARLALVQTAGEELAFGREAVTLPTEGLPDGRYTLTATAQMEGTTTEEAATVVNLNGEALARFGREEAARGEMLRANMGRVLGDYDAEPRTPEGRVDLPRLFEQVEAAHMTMYDFLIWHASTDWEDFQLFLPEAKRRGLKVWVTLVPPSEPPPSAPSGLDYPKWAEEIGKLSLQHDNLVALVIDDFDGNVSPGPLSPAYIADVVATLRRVNPKVAFLPTIYWGTIGNQEVMREYGPYMDGLVFPYADLESTEELPRQLEACREWIGPNKLLYVNVYASGSSGPAEKGPRSAEYMRSMLDVSHGMSDGIRIYCLPKGDPTDYRFAITAERYGEWGKE